MTTQISRNIRLIPVSRNSDDSIDKLCPLEWLDSQKSHSNEIKLQEDSTEERLNRKNFEGSPKTQFPENVVLVLTARVSQLNQAWRQSVHQLAVILDKDFMVGRYPQESRTFCLIFLNRYHVCCIIQLQTKDNFGRTTLIL